MDGGLLRKSGWGSDGKGALSRVSTRAREELLGGNLPAAAAIISLASVKLLMFCMVFPSFVREPSVKKATACVVLCVYIWYISRMAINALRNSIAWQQGTGLNVVMTYGIGSSVVAFCVNRIIPMNRGPPWQEALIVSAHCLKLQVLPFRALVVQHLLYLTGALLSQFQLSVLPPLWAWEGLTSALPTVVVNYALGLFFMCVICLARNRDEQKAVLDFPKLRAIEDWLLEAVPEERAEALLALVCGTYVGGFFMMVAAGFTWADMPPCYPSTAGLASLLALFWGSSDTMHARNLAAAQAHAYNTVRNLLHNVIPAHVAHRMEDKESRRGLKSMSASQHGAVRLSPPQSTNTSVTEQRSGSFLQSLRSMTSGRSYTDSPAGASKMSPKSHDGAPTQDDQARPSAASRLLGPLIPRALMRRRSLQEGSRPSTHTQQQQQQAKRRSSADTLLEQVQEEQQHRDHTQQQQQQHRQVHKLPDEGQHVQWLDKEGGRSQGWLREPGARDEELQQQPAPSQFMLGDPEEDVSEAGSEALDLDSETYLDRFTSYSERHQSVTCIFSDLVSFTSLSEQLKPSQVMALLADLYSKFDRAATELNVFPVDSQGDSYMSAVNLIDEEPNQADVAVAFAKRLLQIATSTVTPLGRLGLRIGIHTGSLMSGVLGANRLKFTLVGDTVNTASRMESTALHNTIQISSSTFELLREKRIAGDDPNSLTTTPQSPTPSVRTSAFQRGGDGKGGGEGGLASPGGVRDFEEKGEKSRGERTSVWGQHSGSNARAGDAGGAAHSRPPLSPSASSAATSLLGCPSSPTGGREWGGRAAGVAGENGQGSMQVKGLESIGEGSGSTEAAALGARSSSARSGSSSAQGALGTLGGRSSFAHSRNSSAQGTQGTQQHSDAVTQGGRSSFAFYSGSGRQCTQQQHSDAGSGAAALGGSAEGVTEGDGIPGGGGGGGGGSSEPHSGWQCAQHSGGGGGGGGSKPHSSEQIAEAAGGQGSKAHSSGLLPPVPVTTAAQSAQTAPTEIGMAGGAQDIEPASRVSAQAPAAAEGRVVLKDEAGIGSKVGSLVQDLEGSTGGKSKEWLSSPDEPSRPASSPPSVIPHGRATQQQQQQQQQQQEGTAAAAAADTRAAATDLTGSPPALDSSMVHFCAHFSSASNTGAGRDAHGGSAFAPAAAHTIPFARRSPAESLTSFADVLSPQPHSSSPRVSTSMTALIHDGGRRTGIFHARRSSCAQGLGRTSSSNNTSCGSSTKRVADIILGRVHSHKRHSPSRTVSPATEGDGSSELTGGFERKSGLMRRRSIAFEHVSEGNACEGGGKRSGQRMRRRSHVSDGGMLSRCSSGDVPHGEEKGVQEGQQQDISSMQAGGVGAQSWDVGTARRANNSGSIVFDDAWRAREVSVKGKGMMRVWYLATRPASQCGRV